jgi:hypothetical protein
MLNFLGGGRELFLPFTGNFKDPKEQDCGSFNRCPQIL